MVAIEYLPRGGFLSESGVLPTGATRYRFTDARIVSINEKHHREDEKFFFFDTYLTTLLLREDGCLDHRSRRSGGRMAGNFSLAQQPQRVPTYLLGIALVGIDGDARTK